MAKSKKPFAGAQKMSKRKSVVPKDEPKPAKLVRLATLRTKRIIKSIDALGNLSRLKPTEAQTEAVFSAIKAVVESSYSRWKGEKPEVDFSIPPAEQQQQ